MDTNDQTSTGVLLRICRRVNFLVGVRGKNKNGSSAGKIVRYPTTTRTFNPVRIGLWVTSDFAENPPILLRDVIVI